MILSLWLITLSLWLATAFGFPQAAMNIENDVRIKIKVLVIVRLEDK